MRGEDKRLPVDLVRVDTNRPKRKVEVLADTGRRRTAREANSGQVLERGNRPGVSRRQSDIPTHQMQSDEASGRSVSRGDVRAAVIAGREHCATLQQLEATTAVSREEPHVRRTQVPSDLE